ncbi:MAG: tartrate dehydrogenase [Thermomicrobiales bacterium]|nr:tartrate dehydrogenase [Thermomicrobiales bacterium]
MVQKTYRIAVVPGDGIGMEVTPEAIKVLDRVAELSGGAFGFSYTSFPWGSHYYLETGTVMDEGGLETLRSFDAILFGATGWPTVPDHVSLYGFRLVVCKGFDLFASVRPVRLFRGIHSPLRNGTPETIDWIMVRENSEGEYSGIGGRNLGSRGDGKELAIESALFTAEGCERIIRYAFEIAATRPRKHVTSVTKSNAQQYGMTLWDDCFARIRAEFPEIGADQVLVDACAARMVLHPESFDVVVASNLFGDILSDLGGAIGGSLGIAASGNIDPLRRNPSMFEPVHGSAPDIAGQGIANPIATIWSAAMMLEHLGESAAANQIMNAIERATASGMVTRDLGGSATTADAGDAILHALEGNDG